MRTYPFLTMQDLKKASLREGGSRAVGEKEKPPSSKIPNRFRINKVQFLVKDFRKHC